MDACTPVVAPELSAVASAERERVISGRHSMVTGMVLKVVNVGSLFAVICTSALRMPGCKHNQPIGMNAFFRAGIDVNHGLL